MGYSSVKIFRAKNATPPQQKAIHLLRREKVQSDKFTLCLFQCVRCVHIDRTTIGLDAASN